MKMSHFKILTLLSFIISCFTGIVQAQETVQTNKDIKNNDSVNIAFGKVKQENLIGSISFINSDDILKNDNVQWISEALLGRIPGLLGYSNIRGIGDALFIVDGMPRDISTINLAEVEQITILKDINSSILYGSAAVNGVVLITTKRGNPNKKQIKVTGYYGTSVPTKLPEYLSSADYMSLYNEARINDGLMPLYDKEMIGNYRSGSNPYRYPNIDYYSNEYLKSHKPFSKVMAEFSGGNKTTAYYSNMGWEQIGSLLDFGEGKKSKQNRFNVRGNIDIQINSFIKSSLDAAAIIINKRSPVVDYWKSTSTLKPNLFSPLIPINLIDPDNVLLTSRKNDIEGKYLLGGTQSYLTNPIASIYCGGYNENIQNNFSFNNKIDFDLDNLVKGLAFHTNLSFEYYTTYNQSINNDYSVYEPVWDGDSITSLTKYGNDKHNGYQTISDSYYERRLGFHGLLDYNRTFNEIHQVSGSLLAFGNLYKIMGDIQGNKNINLGLRLNYIYNKKYMIDFSSSYVNSVKLPEKSRRAFSPSLGLAWMISSEDFMSSAENIDYLKLRLTGGILNSDLGISGFYYYLNQYNYGNYFSWNEQNNYVYQGVVSIYGGNDALKFEKRKELNLGLEGSFFNQKLYLETSVFASSFYNQITRPLSMYPSFYSDFIPYKNFEDNAYRGAEIGLTFKQNIEDLIIAVGANALYATSEIIKKDEVYADSYQYRKGHPVDALFGLVADGLFMNPEDINNHATQAFGTVKPGDIKYVDQNNDGIIDENDEVRIGRSQAPFSYGLNFRLTYKGISLFAMGNGQIGADSYIRGNYYWVDQDDKYSKYILNRWTEETRTTATYPRLTTSASSNNFRNSTFWLYRDNYFTLQRVQLTYEFPKNIVKTFRMKELNCFLDASNLLTISKHRDIKELRVGSEPFYRSFSLGVKVIF
ncbi:MAG: SusC/RagA family TonB-linked outer membrane protein [Petrimonas sp.]|nr:SusC/RagA family TonB-linked outer membrane protein [Petrimonas sp.]